MSAEVRSDMGTVKSLSTFFSATDPVTLDNCDSEQIHLTGQIQNIGALLVVDPETTFVVGASQNAEMFLGVEPGALLSAPLADINADLAEQIADAEDEVQILHEVLDFGLEHEGIQYDTVTHCHSGRRIIEFVPNLDPSARSVRGKMRHCSKACAQIMHSKTFDEAKQIAADALRWISGYSRIKIYRFQSDWSGEVIAESLDGALPSYSGLCFPAGDIPKQVREIMSIVPFRSIGTTSDDTLAIHASENAGATLDLTWSVLRSVSKMHTAYTRNMGVEATFSCSLMHEGGLWGLIVAHNNSPGAIPFDSWALMQEIGAALMLRYGHQQRADTSDMISNLRKIENQFASALRKSGDVEDVIVNLVPILRQFLQADGVAFQHGDRMHVSGRTPPADFIRELNKWAMTRDGSSDQLQTNMLHAEWAPAAAHIDTACGVLIQPVMVHRVCQLIWFRGPITRTVRWAGRAAPNKDRQDGDKLNPRNSFEVWVEEHNDQSKPWLDAELESASQIFTEILDIIAAQLLLKEENDALRDFASTAAHDLKAPLRGINMALDWMRDDGFEQAAVQETHAMAQKSSKKLTDLVEGLLELSVVRDQELKTTLVDLQEVVSDVSDILSIEVLESGAHIEISSLPSIMANRRLMLRLLLNLVSNGIKYRHPERVPKITISAAPVSAEKIEIAVTDNGMGVEEKYAERIFEPMKRLHSKDTIEGTGLGLAICKRIVEMHGGQIGLDTTFEGGARFLITLPSPQETAI